MTQDRMVYPYYGDHTPGINDHTSAIKVANVTDTMNGLDIDEDDEIILDSFSITGKITTNQHYWPFQGTLYMVAADGTISDFSGASHETHYETLDTFCAEKFTYKQLGRVENSQNGSQDSGGAEFCEIFFGPRTYNVPKRLKKPEATRLFMSSDQESYVGAKAQLCYVLTYGHRDAATAVRWQFTVSYRFKTKQMRFGSMEGI